MTKLCIGDKVSVAVLGKRGEITGLDWIPGQRGANEYEVRLGDGSFVYKKRSELVKEGR